MADETKESQGTAPEATPKKKGNWKARRLPIAIAVVVVVAVLGVAGWAWRATPEYCDTMCHNTMGKYYDSFMNDTTSLAYAHKGVVEGQCLGCHEQTLSQMGSQIASQLSGNYTDPMAKQTFSNDFCLQSGCHTGAGVMPGATESSTADWSFDPHSTKHGVQQCNSCHLMHDQSVFTCAGCHTWGGTDSWSKTPDGWTEYTLDDGSITAAPEGWTIPQLFEASSTE